MYVRSVTEYGALAWSTYFMKHIRKLEKVKRFSARLPKLSKLMYEDRLKWLRMR